MGRLDLGLATREAVFSPFPCTITPLRKIDVNTTAVTPSNRLIDNNAENHP
ncbi:hypothetical protein AWB82_02507 [Caballeronia glebae]|uniref:Uncharacterized protein n=1 Tax=Caballeronia glebae TaxID=1777143 RepID=A0A158AL55_9BURK|nr:hypothetical protein AWB82_02507 [Caballeronia glebae]